MHTNFGEWYRNVSLTTDNENLKKRWTGVVAVPVARDDVLQLVRLAFSEEATIEFLEKFRAAFKQADAGFPAQGNDAELRLLASAVLIDLFGQNRENAAKAEMLAALGCVTADLGGLRRKQCVNGDLIKQAYAFLQSAATSRADWTALDSDDEITADELKSLLAVTAEESNILWWLFGGRSRIAGKPFDTLPVEALAFVAAKDLSDLTRVAPGAVSIPAIIARVLSEGKGKADGLTELVELAKAAPADWDAATTVLPDTWLTTSPVRAMVRAIRSGASADRRRIDLRLKKGVKLSATALAQQIYWEFQWERAWNRG